MREIRLARLEAQVAQATPTIVWTLLFFTYAIALAGSCVFPLMALIPSVGASFALPLVWLTSCDGNPITKYPVLVTWLTLLAVAAPWALAIWHG